ALLALSAASGPARAWGPERRAGGRAPVATAVVVLVATIGAVPLLRNADRVVRDKLTSFGGLQDAGRWIAAHSDPDDTIMSASVAQLTYYTVRRNLLFPKDVDEFVRVLHDGPPRYIV